MTNSTAATWCRAGPSRYGKCSASVGDEEFGIREMQNRIPYSLSLIPREAVPPAPPLRPQRAHHGGLRRLYPTASTRAARPRPIGPAADRPADDPVHHLARQRLLRRPL